MTQFDLPHDHGGHITQIIAHSPTPEEFRDVSLLLRQLGDGNRLRLFWILCHCEECVINLSAMMDMSSPAISHHLKQLRISRLITSRRDGKEVYYRAADNAQAQLLHRLVEDLVEGRCPSEEEDPHPSRQVETVMAIHRQLTEHLEERPTIEELSRQYLINTSTLKETFKQVYGMPIAAYMKDYRLCRAAQLLRETEDSVGEIAAQVGYENQSKFTAAFKEAFYQLPTRYREADRSALPPADGEE